MRCAILSIGTEILFGQIVNTNTAYLTKELNNMGFDVLYHHTVGDNPDRLRKIIIDTFRECDLIVCTGGLGPTEDDLTKEVIAETLGDKLEMHGPSLKALEDIAKKRNWNMSKNNYKQAMMPREATVFLNDVGTAPGFALVGTDNAGHDLKGKIIVCMPGPPREMLWMWGEWVKKYLMAFKDKAMSYKIIRTFGIGESQLETELLPLIDGQTDPTIATYAKEGESSLRVASQRDTIEEADRAVCETIEKIKNIVGEYIYSTEDEDLHSIVGKTLLEKDITISCCESCTGGMFSNKLIEVEGISDVFDRGLVTYSEEAKMDELGVSQDTLKKFGAESPEVAIEMVVGIAEKTGSRICVSSTGVAGPESKDGKEPGTMYIGVYVDGEYYVKELNTGRKERQVNRNACMLNMFNEVRKALIKM